MDNQATANSPKPSKLTIYIANKYNQMTLFFHAFNQFEPHIEVTIFLDVRASEAYDNPYPHNRSDLPAARVEGLIFWYFFWRKGGEAHREIEHDMR